MIVDGRGSRRSYRFIFSSLLVLAASLVAFGGVASANTVSSIRADCKQVSVYLHDFPRSGVLVHIAVRVESQAPINRDVWVTNATPVAVVDVSAATLALQGGRADVDVDVTWTLLGTHHAHETETVTGCTPAPSTSIATTTAPLPTTTSVPETTTTVPETTTTVPETTTTVPETTTSVGVLSVTTVSSPTSTTGNVGSLPSTTVPVAAPGALVLLPTTPESPAAGTLPRTGVGSEPPALFGLTALVSGALLVLRRRRVWR